MVPHLALLCSIAFIAGCIDAIVGGGGLVQTPACLVLLPQYPVATVIGTLKIPAFCGTGVAATQYARRVRLEWKPLLLMTTLAALAAFAGSRLLTVVSNQFMKPLLLAVLVVVALYTWTNKKFGDHTHKTHSPPAAGGSIHSPSASSSASTTGLSVPAPVPF